MAVLGEVSLVSSLERDKSGLEEGGIGRRGFGKEEEEGGGGKREREKERNWPTIYLRRSKTDTTRPEKENQKTNAKQSKA